MSRSELTRDAVEGQREVIQAVLNATLGDLLEIDLTMAQLKALPRSVFVQFPVTVVGVGVALRPVGLGCGIRGGYGVVRDPEKGQTRPNQPLHLTGAALPFRATPHRCSGPGR